MIEGWLLPRVNVDMALHDWTLNVEFFSEVLHQMRTESVYSHIVDEAIVVIEQLDWDDFNAFCLQPAIRRRDIVRQQCSNIDAEASFSKPIPAYTIKQH